MPKICAVFLLALFVAGCGGVQQEADSSSELTNTDLHERIFVKDPWVLQHMWLSHPKHKKNKLYPYYLAAKKKKLPLVFFRDLLNGNHAIGVKKSDWPRYQAGRFYGGTIYYATESSDPTTWKAKAWAQFYNELYHAWWDKVFLKEQKYHTYRTLLFTSANATRYRRANSKNWRLAQEEGFSETVASLLLYMYPVYRPAIDGKPAGTYYVSSESFGYQRGTTVCPVSHGDRPGFSAAAETTYMSEAEYRLLIVLMAGIALPEE